jgi:hypothetical protein
MTSLIQVTRPTKMLRYNRVSRILLILSVINFALAAPVLIEEKRQAGVDLVHEPERVGEAACLGRVGEGRQPHLHHQAQHRRSPTMSR